MKFKTKKKCETKSKAIEYQALKELRLELGMTLTDASPLRGLVSVLDY